ncbi:MAG: type IV pili methyl-accepting chemotaxis transducer N-terminal domain-containing protein [Gammaproteobacteria bacterium]|jgi:twitching motility protein PilJ|nr:type IV pili methyl-accepting chemotaxis transducer N-terminal domain-containing protein [Gammaproteobacteria bacterium]MBP6481629.1 type IV pili methyl-accepting chemotaxis transducer N-terminal domain-containing protein [Pseudomonadales bacterium]MBP7911714.1 type IV pili methyl-accepting chemotaxis transducer N-terminal domain-containing protein [Pseudomonadales bacterium]
MNAKQNVPAASQPNVRWILVWGSVLVVAVLAFVWNLFVIMRDTNRDAGYRELVGNLRVLSQQIEANAREAVDGDAAAFTNLESARADFGRTLDDLANGTDALPSPREALAEELALIGETWSVVDPAAATIVARKESIEFLSKTSATLAGSIEDVQKRTARIAEVLAGSGATVRQVALAERQSWLAERISRNLDRMLEGGSGATEAAEQFNADTESFADVLDGMLEGSAAMGIPALANAGALADAREVKELFRVIGGGKQRILDSAPDLKQARQAAETIVQSAPKLLNATSVTSDRINDLEGERKLNMGSALAFGVLIVLALVMIGIQWTLDTRRRLAQTAATNERNQQAILRLLDELAGLADGDLTTSATVTGDFTGAIADAINYTIDQLRVLVSSINQTSRNVSQAAEDTQATALHLAEAAEHQAQEIAGASSAITEMAMTIDQVSSNAAESAGVADRSVALANTGSRVVQNTIGGMDMIREQIQETAKRIKRLGESSQEIGDIVSLINDIADQTNILALNAAIQASMAGEAGRGFAVVADEVQRLAERSGGATRQIEALVKTIQSDTHEAVTSMEQTTAEVVRGARLAEDAGVALEEIESVSKNLAALIQNISNAARQQASSAGHISNTMNIIQEITSQTSAGTTATAQSIGKLAAITNELRNSVAGFKLPDDGRGARGR